MFLNLSRDMLNHELPNLSPVSIGYETLSIMSCSTSRDLYMTTLHGYWWVHIKNILSLDIFLCGACNRGLIFIHIALCKNHNNGAQSFLKWNLNIHYDTIRYDTIDTI